MQVKSDTQSGFGRSALNCRLTRSSGRGAVISGNVVRIRLPRTVPRNPCRISRPTVQRATAMPFRFICCQTLDTPYTCMLACQTRLISGISISARFARVLAWMDREAVPHGAGSPTGQSARPDRLARPRRYRDADRRKPSGFETAVELRLGENALATLRISFARRSSLTSRSSTLIRSRSSVLTLSRSPRSTSSGLIQSNNICGVQSIMGAIDSTAAHIDGCSLRCSRTVKNTDCSLCRLCCDDNLPR